MKKPRSERAKFVTRTITLSDEAIVARAKLVLDNLPIDTLRPLQLVIQEAPKKRSLDQNNYYWMRLGEIAEQAWSEGRQFTSDVWHEYARRNLMPDKIMTKDGVRRSKWTEMPDGSTTIISTTMLDRASFADYCTALEAFGSELGVLFSADPRQFGGT